MRKVTSEEMEERRQRVRVLASLTSLDEAHATGKVREIMELLGAWNQ